MLLAYSAYESSQKGHQGSGDGEFGGSAALNSTDNNRPPSSGPSTNVNTQTAVSTAAYQSGQDSGLFAQAMSAIQGMSKEDADDIDEEKITNAHDTAYNTNSSGKASDLSANSMGAAAALQAFKTFTSGTGNSSSSSGGATTAGSSTLLGMAMSEAAKLFDQSGGAANGGSKNDVVTAAGQMIMKLLLKKEMQGATVGGANSGGLGGLMGMASKYL